SLYLLRRTRRELSPSLSPSTLTATVASRHGPADTFLFAKLAPVLNEPLFARRGYSRIDSPTELLAAAGLLALPLLGFEVLLRRLQSGSLGKLWDGGVRNANVIKPFLGTHSLQALGLTVHQTLEDSQCRRLD